MPWGWFATARRCIPIPTGMLPRWCFMFGEVSENLRRTSANVRRCFPKHREPSPNIHGHGSPDLPRTLKNQFIMGPLVFLAKISGGNGKHREKICICHHRRRIFPVGPRHKHWNLLASSRCLLMPPDGPPASPPKVPRTLGEPLPDASRCSSISIGNTSPRQKMLSGT